jgi:hypothetical protein
MVGHSAGEMHQVRKRNLPGTPTDGEIFWGGAKFEGEVPRRKHGLTMRSKIVWQS